MHKLIANLSYEHEAGRLAAIDMLSVLISKLPKELLATYAPVLFLPLVTRLVNDTSAKCRQDIGSAITTLMKARYSLTTIIYNHYVSALPDADMQSICDSFGITLSLSYMLGTCQRKFVANPSLSYVHIP